MKVVLQDEISGCGLAVVATVTGKYYDEVKRYANSIGIYAEDKKLYSGTVYVRKLLIHYGSLKFMAPDHRLKLTETVLKQPGLLGLMALAVV